MRRYLLQEKFDTLPKEAYDILIIGSGIAGLYAALHTDPSRSCAIITKVDLEHSNSWLAQGGIAAVIAPDDQPASHVEDTLLAGAGLCNREAVELLVREGPKDIRELVELQVPFDVNAEGELQITREGGHSRRRIVHCGGDATGRETTRRLGEIALERKNLHFLFNTYLIDLVTENGAVTGAVIFDREPKYIACRNVIIATGGIGQLYQNSTNPKGAVGDGIACAARAGAVLDMMEMVQFHPTTLIPHSNSERLFLISEAVRGEGGILKNKNGEPFMQGRHPLADLAPRDIVTREILSEMRRTQTENVYLDVSSMTESFFRERFPTIYAECRSFGIHVPDDWIPVRPAQHYFMGGVKTNLDGMTNIDGLYACGEAACTGIHGGNRLASNSMLECLVFGRRCAEHITRNFRQTDERIPEYFPTVGNGHLTGNYIFRTKAEIREIMTNEAGALRTFGGLERAQRRMQEILGEIENVPLTYAEEFELYNMAQNAAAIICSAAMRRSSAGAHFIADDEK